ncbi:MAG: serine hydrolase domain-containing protein [Acidimicrobiales bacterium]
MLLPDGVHGECHPHFSAVSDALATQLRAGAHRGVAVAVRHRGRPVVDLWGGTFAEDTLALSFSTTKGPVALAAHMALERAGVGYETAVAALWPEFGCRGKATVTIRQLLCHEAGIPQIRDRVGRLTEIADWDAMVAMVQDLPPLWEPGTANGYHALTWGWLVAELVRRVDGRRIDDFLAEEVAGPLGLDGCFVGTPAAERHRLARLQFDAALAAMPALEDLLPADSITLRAIFPPGDVLDFFNSDLGVGACAPAVTGSFTARSLATVYASLEQGGALDGVRLLRPETVAAATAVQNTRPDLVLLVPMHWRLGFMGGGLPYVSPAGPHPEAFGHAGFGGSMAMADPRSGLAVAMTLDRLSLDLLGDRRAGAVLGAALAAADGLP